jgi:hypothetical protein
MAYDRRDKITLAAGFGIGILGSSIAICWVTNPWMQLGWCWVLLLTLAGGTIALLNG